MSKPPRSAPRDNSIDPDGEFTMNVPEQLFYLLFQIVRHRDALFDAEMAPLGLTIAHWRTLAIVRRLQNCSMKDLSRFSTVDRTTLTRSVDHLVQDGILDRHVPPTDRRMVMLTLTAKGEAVYDKAVKLLLAFNRRILVGVDPKGARDLTRAMETVLGNLVGDAGEAQSIIQFGHGGVERQA